MQNLPAELHRKLLSLAQRKLNAGELFLLGKALADSLPLAPADTDNVALYTLSHRSRVNDVLFAVSEFSFLSQDDFKTIYRIIDQLTLWRMNVAYTPAPVLFSGDANTVIDDLSGLLRYVDPSLICSVGEIATSASWVLGMFKDLVLTVRSASV